VTHWLPCVVSVLVGGTVITWWKTACTAAGAGESIIGHDVVTI